MFLDLPVELCEWILRYLDDPADLVSLHRSCKFCCCIVDGALPGWLRTRDSCYEAELLTLDELGFFAGRCKGGFGLCWFIGNKT